MDTVDFQGIRCVELSNGMVTLLATQSVGPRLVSLRFADADNIFAVLPEATLDCPGSGLFHFYGGHRLWYAPENPRVTYLPDDAEVGVEIVDQGLRLIQGKEQDTGIQKEIIVRLAQDRAVVHVDHKLINHSDAPVTLAPWAITQLRTGGVAILPQSELQTAVLPNRSISLWPYTDVEESNVSWGNRYILLRAEMQTAFKVGFPNPRGWLAYFLEGMLFVKRSDFDWQADYYDFGSSSECYCNEKFLELETLGPIGTLEPGESVTHIETWEVYPDVDPPEDENAAQSLVEELGLEK